ncbi:MAG: thioredoxin family protein, partial [Verrucomicrobiota bacterium]
MKQLLGILSIFITSALLHAQQPAAWLTDYATAANQAKAEKKDLLIVFTGSEWIEICRVFEENILSQPDFIDSVGANYVLLKLEFPKNNKLPEEKAKVYQLLKNSYRVQGYPTVVLTDSEARPFGINGYQPVTAAEYAKVVNVMQKGRLHRDEQFQKAQSMQGPERAKTIADAIPQLPGSLSARYYRYAMEEAIRSDPQDQSGVGTRFRNLIADVEYSNQMQSLS